MKDTVADSCVAADVVMPALLIVGIAAGRMECDWNVRLNCVSDQDKITDNQGCRHLV